MTIGSKLRGLALLVLLVVATERAANARERSVVELTVDDPQIEATIRELLERIGVSVVTAPASEGTELALRAIVTRSTDGNTSVVVRAARDGHVILQRELADTTTPAVRREVIAHEVQSAVEAELVDEPASDPTSAPAPVTTAPEPPPPPPTPALEVDRTPPVTKPPSSIALDLALFAAAGPLASSGVAPRIGGMATLASTRAPRFSVTAAGAYAIPFASESSLVTARTSLVAARVLPAVTIAQTRTLSLDLAIGGGVDVFIVDPSSASLPSSTLGQRTTRVDPIVASMATVRVALASNIALLFAAGADVDLSTRAYVLQQGSAQDTVFAPWRVRPTLLAGIAFTALGQR